MNEFNDYMESKPPINEWSEKELYRGAELLSLSYLEDAGWKLVDDFVVHNSIIATLFKDSDGNNVLVGFEGAYSNDKYSMPEIDVSTKAMMNVRELLLGYLQRYEDEHKVRFDIISVLFLPDKLTKVRHMHGYMGANIG